MSAPELEDARRLVLAAFRWVDGHADIAGLFRDAELLRAIGPALAAPFRSAEVTAVASPEARGFVLGALVAAELGAGLVLVRKQGAHHPGTALRQRTEPDWRGRRLLLGLHRNALGPDDRVLVVDDWVETGSQAAAVAALVARCGATAVGVTAVVDDCDEATGRRLGLTALVRADELPPSR